MTCGAPLLGGVRFCTRCGAAVTGEADEVALTTTGRRLLLTSDALSLRELLAVVEAGVAYWRERLERERGVARERAAAAIRQLSQILDNLALQIAQGRETVRITGHLLPQRTAPRPCARCGRGNREQANYCMACGAALRPGLHPLEPPTRAPSLSIAARSDVGRRRPLNEDTFYAGEFAVAEGVLGTLLLVADGMGGHQAGEVAAALARDGLKQTLTATLSLGVPADDLGWHDLLRHSVLEVNRRIYDHAQANTSRRGMGTTVTLAVVTGGRAHVAHVGDSRAYLMNVQGVTGDGSTWIQLTTDHTLIARLVDIGQLTPEQARLHPQRNVLYRSLGSDPTVEVDTFSQALAPGDLLLFCSDGLVSYVEDAELARIVIAEPSIDRACEQLVALANERGGSDNISVVIARFRR